MQQGLIVGLRRRNLGEKIELRFKFKLGKKRLGTLPTTFIPLSETVSQQLNEHLNGALIDEPYSTAIVNKKRKHIEWETFYPYGKSDPRVKEPRKLGVGAKAHTAIVKYLAKNFPKHKISSGEQVSGERKKHLRAMGIDYRKKYSIAHYLRKTREYNKRKTVEEQKRVA